MINVLITDDHILLAEGLKKIINDSPIAKVVAVAHSGNECHRLLRENLPDVLLLDINLPDTDGITLCAELKTLYPSLKVLALTSYGEYTMVRRMMESGASGYILKNAMAEEMLEGIEVVASGKNFLCHEVDLLMKKQANNAIWLTPRERQLLQLIAEGNTNQEIAEKIFLGVETVNSYRKNLLFKLGARNTAVLVKKAFEQKLI
ncbi:MAG: response regulator transcription factor [Chitinophagaceae bacterium]|nr:response regulator transcription factor [Chitinophagaceae bacterium]MBK8951932.1 response regulator transcription factor [Chitinophagaceae bacterium]